MNRLKKLNPYLISYCFSLLLIFFFLFTYRQVFFVMLLFIFLLMPILTVTAMRYASSRITLNAYAECESVEEGNPVRIRIETNHARLFPLLDCGITFEAKNLFFDNPREYHLSFPILPNKRNTVFIPIETAHPGLIQVSIHSFVMTELFHLYQKEIPLEIRLAVPVLPKTVTVAPVIPTAGADTLEEYTEYDNHGTPSSDIREIREYLPGDRLQRIHWKLSAKLDDLFVKVMDQTSTVSLLVLPELTKLALHETLTTFYSLSSYLIAHEERFQICLYQDHTCEFDYHMITDETQLYDCFVHLCYLPTYEGTDTALCNFKNSGQKSGILVHIVGIEIEFEEYGIH